MRIPSPSHLTLACCVRLWLSLGQLKRRLALGLTALVSATLSRAALADDDIAGMINSVTNGASSIQPGLLKAALTGGVVCVLVGIGLWFRKKSDPHVKGWHIVSAIGIGCILIGLDQFIKRGQTQLGLQAVSVD